MTIQTHTWQHCSGVDSACPRQVVEQLSLKDESREEALVMLTILEDSLRILEQHRACAASRCKS
jgi:hypothetical protein